MTTIYNLRGTNGSGKTTLARKFLPEPLTGGPNGGPIDLNAYAAPTKKDPDRRLRVTGYMNRDTVLGSVGVIGPYNTATGGMDNIPSFEIQQDAIVHMVAEEEPRHVIAEGVLAATVFGSWGVFAGETNKGGEHEFVFIYLTTPLEVCLDRIRQRQEASGKVREIKADLVADKVKAIASTRTKAIAAGFRVYDLPFWGELPESYLRAIMLGAPQGEECRAS